MEKQAQVVQPSTQLIEDGHLRFMVVETDLMVLRIHYRRTNEQGAVKPVLIEGAFFE